MQPVRADLPLVAPLATLRTAIIDRRIDQSRAQGLSDAAILQQLLAAV